MVSSLLSAARAAADQTTARSTSTSGSTTGSTSGTSSSSSTSGTSSSSTTTDASKTLAQNFQSFLTLLTEELKHQDPTAPMDTKEFTQQLVQFSQVEQQINTNKKLDTLVSNAALSEQTDAISYIGKAIAVPGATTYFNGVSGSTGQWNFSLPSDSASTTLQIVSSSGTVVWSGNGATTAGAHNLTWDGTDGQGNLLNAGDYTLKVTAKDGSDKTIKPTITTRGQVTSVESQNGVTYLMVGSTPYKLSDVTEIMATSAASQSADSNG